jgi:hypothetical protein
MISEDEVERFCCIYNSVLGHIFSSLCSVMKNDQHLLFWHWDFMCFILCACYQFCQLCQYARTRVTICGSGVVLLCFLMSLSYCVF